MVEKEFKTLNQVVRNFRKLKSCATDTDDFMSRCFPLLLKQLIEMNEKLDKLGKHKREPTEYQLKIGKYMKEGKSLQEAHKMVNAENKHKV